MNATPTPITPATANRLAVVAVLVSRTDGAITRPALLAALPAGERNASHVAASVRYLARTGSILVGEDGTVAVLNFTALRRELAGLAPLRWDEAEWRPDNSPPASEAEQLLYGCGECVSHVVVMVHNTTCKDYAVVHQDACPVGEASPTGPYTLRRVNL